MQETKNMAKNCNYNYSLIKNSLTFYSLHNTAISWPAFLQFRFNC